MKHILVTGASGFIGRRLVNQLRIAGNNVTTISSRDGDIADPNTFSKLHELDIDFIYHLAGKTFVPESWTNPALFHRINVGGTINVLDLCRRKKIPMAYVSSYLYGIPKYQPIDELHPIEPNNPYALSKANAEDLCRFYSLHFDIPIAIFRPFNIFGPGQSKLFLIPKIINQIFEDKLISLDDLSPRRDYLYVDDLIDALLCSMHRRNHFDIFNIGSGKSLSVGEIVHVIQDCAGTNLKVQTRDKMRRNEIPDLIANINKAKVDLQWTPRHTFIDGVKESLAARLL